MPLGSCLCGDLGYEIAGPFVESHHCHCGICRKSHGTAYASYGTAAADGLRWLRGAAHVARYESSPGFERAFCPRCGSTVPGSAFAGLAFVPLANLAGDPGARPEQHLFTASQAPWWEIRDALPRHAAFPPGFDAPVQPGPAPRDPPARGARGSCLCGRVAFVVEGAPRRAWHCHCARCRRGCAAGHSSDLFVAPGGLRFTRGEGEIALYEAPGPGRFAQAFCRRCGALAPCADPASGLVGVPMGALDDDPGVRPDRHVNVSERAPWIEIRDELPRHAGLPE
jgi:hypothetical protein